VNPYWPLFGLRVRTPRVELRPPDDDDVVALVALINQGIHDPDTMPFSVPWTDEVPPQRDWHSLQHFWGTRANLKPEEWHLPLMVSVDGEPVGVQALTAEHFPTLRTVITGSWVGRAHQGRGIGQEMRAAALHLAFEGLGATAAYSAAWHDNAASLGVSRALGYEANGDRIELRRGKPDLHLELKLTRDRWEERRRDDIVIEGLEPCLPLLGLADG
jgi:RimJ/RimL family protein N-acetyltransferase